jgi:uncharacterized SAM-binding protein YcdF (DUF218 family)
MKLVLRGLAAVVILLLAGITALYLTAPASNTGQSRFEALIVLGYPARADGTPEPEMRARVLEAVREFKAGVAPRIIMTGGAAHNRFAEADVMARLAEANGVPASAIVPERDARNTIENAAYSVKIMQAHAWRSAEVITTPAHVPRSGVIFSVYPIAWRTRASQWPPEYTILDKVLRYVYEAQAAARLRLAGPPRPH